MFVIDDDYVREMYKRGLSLELTERIEADSAAVVCVSMNNDLCSILTHPPVEKDDLIYFIIYKGVEIGVSPKSISSKCARISMLSPEYIKCSDCSKEEWILNYDEKKALCRILRDDGYWKYVLLSYMDALISWDIGKKIDISNLPMPDYMQLPEE